MNLKITNSRQEKYRNAKQRLGCELGCFGLGVTWLTLCLVKSFHSIPAYVILIIMTLVSCVNAVGYYRSLKTIKGESAIGGPEAREQPADSTPTLSIPDTWEFVDDAMLPTPNPAEAEWRVKTISPISLKCIIPAGLLVSDPAFLCCEDFLDQLPKHLESCRKFLTSEVKHWPNHKFTIPNLEIDTIQFFAGKSDYCEVSFRDPDREMEMGNWSCEWTDGQFMNKSLSNSW